MILARTSAVQRDTLLGKPPLHVKLDLRNAICPAALALQNPLRLTHSLDRDKPN